MTVGAAHDFLLSCLVVNYGILLLWFLVFWFCHDWMLKLHSRWFHMSTERFDTIHYVCMAVYKIGILLFNLAPYVALRLFGLHAS